MFKRICLLSLASLFIAGLLLSVLSAWYSTSVSAQEENTILDSDIRDHFFGEREKAVNLLDIEDLNSLNLDFGATQNSLVLELVSASGTNKINFALTEISKRIVLDDSVLKQIQLNVDAIDQINLTYVADFQPNFVYRLKENLSQADFSRPSFCEQQLKIVVFPDEDAYDKVNGYSQDWRKFDLNNKSLEVGISLPFLNETTGNTGNDCFRLYEELNFKGSADKPFLALTGTQNFQNSCEGLSLYGRGEDDFNKATTTWLCLEELFLEGEEKDKFTLVESSPFSSYYIFIEDRQDTDHCGSRILVNKADVEENKPTLEAEWQDWHDNCKEGQYDKDKEQKKVASITILNPFKEDSAGDDAEVSLGDTGDTSISNGNSVESSCEFQLGGFGFGWVVCWIIKGISEALNEIESFIYTYLEIEKSDYYIEKIPGKEGEFSIKGAWASMRNFMTFAIVGTALFMVISTALDVSIFSNYTVKKYLPRLIIGTILIQFSWVLGDLMIQVSNQLGDFISAILFASFPGAEKHGLKDIFGANHFAGLLGVGAVGVGGYQVASYGLMNVFTLMPIGITALAIFLYSLLFLVARRYLIVLLLILTPLGLALWVLPGNDKAWNFYFKTFFYLLMIYPLMVIAISAGKIFSYLIKSSDSSIIATIVSFLVYILGFAAVPFLAKSLGGILGKLIGAVNDRTKGVFDRARNHFREKSQAGRANKKSSKVLAQAERKKDGNRGRISRAMDAISEKYDMASKTGMISEKKGERRNKWRKRFRRDEKEYGNFSRAKVLTMQAYSAEKEKKLSDAIENQERLFTGTELDTLANLAGHERTPLFQKTAAITRLLRAGDAGTARVRILMQRAAEISYEEDPNLHIALATAKRLDRFSDKDVLERNPDWVNLSFAESGKFLGTDTDVLNNATSKDLQSWSEGAVKQHLGIDQREDLGEIVKGDKFDTLRDRDGNLIKDKVYGGGTEENIKSFLTVDVIRGPSSARILELFKKLRPKHEETYQRKKEMERIKDERTMNDQREERERVERKRREERERVEGEREKAELIAKARSLSLKINARMTENKLRQIINAEEKRRQQQAEDKRMRDRNELRNWREKEADKRRRPRPDNEYDEDRYDDRDNP